MGWAENLQNLVSILLSWYSPLWDSAHLCLAPAHGPCSLPISPPTQYDTHSKTLVPDHQLTHEVETRAALSGSAQLSVMSLFPLVLWSVSPEFLIVQVVGSSLLIASSLRTVSLFCVTLSAGLLLSSLMVFLG